MDSRPKGPELVSIGAFGGALLLGVAGLAACDAGTAARGYREFGAGQPFAEVFAVAAEIELEQDPTDSIGDIGPLLETSRGELVIGDAIEPAVRRYTETGKLVSRQGAYGEGPFEFRKIGGLAEDRVGRILVVDPDLWRATRLNVDLSPDTSFLLFPRPRGWVQAMGEKFLISSAHRTRTASFTLMDSDWTAVWSIPASLHSTGQYPYWNSYGGPRAAVSSKAIYTAFSLSYPIYIRDSRGVLKDSIQAPASFRLAPVPDPGAFVGDGSQDRRAKWLGSFDVISNLAVVADTLLIVTHGRIARSEQTTKVWTTDDRLDIYNLAAGQKVAADVPLPSGSRVLAGGRYLHLLISEPPRPWTVIRSTVRLDP